MKERLINIGKKIIKHIWKALRTTIVFLELEVSGLLVLWIIYFVKKCSPTLPTSQFDIVNICMNEFELWVFILFNVVGVIILLVHFAIDIFGAFRKAKDEIENTESMYRGNPKVLPTGYDTETESIVNSMDNVGEIKIREKKGGEDNESND